MTEILQPRHVFYKISVHSLTNNQLGACCTKKRHGIDVASFVDGRDQPNWRGTGRFITRKNT